MLLMDRKPRKKVNGRIECAKNGHKGSNHLQSPDIEAKLCQVPMPASALVRVNSFPRKHWMITDGIHIR